MAQLLNMQIQTKTSDSFLLASSKHNANLFLSKKKPSISYRSKRSNIHIACSVSENTTSVAHPRTILVPVEIDIRRSMFPPEFKFDAASAAYQVEGAWNEGGRGPSIWDTFTHKQPHKIKDGSNGDVATDSYYYRYKEDVHMMKKMGIDSYRFSISWSRILPDGTLKGGINREGVMYYNNLINELIKNGITPFVTLFHWDVPQALEDKYGGFLSKEIVNHWTLTVVNPIEERVHFLDPLRGRLCGDEWINTVNSSIAIYNRDTLKKGNKKVQWTPCLGAPRQTGVLTCGLWVMRYMKDIVGDKNQLALAKWERDINNIYSQKDIDIVRVEWATHVHKSAECES